MLKTVEITTTYQSTTYYENVLHIDIKLSILKIVYIQDGLVQERKIKLTDVKNIRIDIKR